MPKQGLALVWIKDFYNINKFMGGKTMYSLENKQIGLGTFPFSGVFSPIKQEEAEEIVREFINLGGHYIETAPIYPRNNVNMASLIKKFQRSDLLIGTKCVLSLDSSGITISSGEPEDIRKQCLEEMQRLQVDYLDLLEAHVTATNVEPKVVAEVLNELKKEGLVRYIGASNASPADIVSYVEGGGLDFVQNRYSIIHRQPTESISDLCEKHNIRFNPYQVIERGQLINTDNSAGEWREGDLRAQKSEYVGDVYERVHTWAINTLGRIAKDAGITLEELSIRWVFSKKQVTLPVVGATKIWQIRKNMSVGTEALPEDVLNVVDNAYFSFSKEIQDVFGLSIEEFRGLV